MLFIDPTQENAFVVSLYNRPTTWLRTKRLTRSKSERLLHAIDGVLGKDRLRMTGIAVAVGEGGFTSIRTGVTVANALAFAWQLPVVRVDVRNFRNRQKAVEHAWMRVAKTKKATFVQPLYAAPAHITPAKVKKRKRMIQEVSAGGVVLHQGRVLVLRTRDGEYLYPKGGINLGETEQEAARREVLEETGYRVRVHEVLGVLVYHYHHPDGAHIKKEVHYFRCSLASLKKSARQVEPHEHFKPLWLTLSQARKKLSFSSLVALLTKAAKKH